MELKTILFLGFIAGIGGGVAGALLTVPIRPGKRVLSVLMELFSGFTLSVICFCLLPQAFAAGKRSLAFIGLLCGVLFAVALQSAVKYLPSEIGRRRARVRATGAVLTLACVLINFTEGLSIGSGFWISAAVGLPAFAMIVLNGLPKGAVVCAVLRFGGLRMPAVLGVCALLGVPTGLGTLCGLLIGGAYPEWIAAAACFAGGAMLYVTEGDLILESKRLYVGRSSGFFNVLGIVLGVLLIDFGCGG